MLYLLAFTDAATGKTGLLEYTDEELGWCFKGKAHWAILNGGSVTLQGLTWRLVSIS